VTAINGIATEETAEPTELAVSAVQYVQNIRAGDRCASSVADVRRIATINVAVRFVVGRLVDVTEIGELQARKLGRPVERLPRVFAPAGLKTVLDLGVRLRHLC
jgi:hypothetical protein